MRTLLIINLLTFTIFLTNSRYFLLNEQPQLTTYYNCLKSLGYNRVALGMHYTQSQIDEDYVQNSQNALNAGMQIQFKFMSYRCRAVKEEVQFLRREFLLDNFQRFWLIPGFSSVGCSWKDYSAEENCQYLKQFSEEMRALNRQFGIFTDSTIWKDLFGSQTACQELGDVPLWWIPHDKEEAQGIDFNNYHQIGGWKTPYAKYLAVTIMCGQPIVKNYFV